MSRERELIVKLANQLASEYLAMLVEGGCRSSSVGEPLCNEDDPLGEACQYLGQSIPIVPDWNGELRELS